MKRRNVTVVTSHLAYLQESIIAEHVEKYFVLPAPITIRPFPHSYIKFTGQITIVIEVHSVSAIPVIC